MAHRTLTARVVSALAGGTLASAAAARPVFTDLGVLPSGQQSVALGVSGNGAVAVGRADMFGASQGFDWENGLGMTPIFGLGGFTAATATNFDGSVVVGSSASATTGEIAWQWSNGTVGQLVSGRATGISSDGSVITGWHGGHAFRWTAATGVVDLPNYPGGLDDGQAFGISGNGQVIVGMAAIAPGGPIDAMRWVGGTIQDLGALPGDAASVASGTNSDGSVVVGASYDSLNTETAFRWTPTAGMQSLGRLAGALSPMAWGVSGDGGVVVGSCTYPNTPQRRAFIWTQAHGMQDLTDLMQSLGLNTGGLSITSA